MAIISLETGEEVKPPRTPRRGIPKELLAKPPSLHGAKPTGRPCSLTYELIEQFRTLIPRVAYIETAADLLCVDRYTWRLWLREAKLETRRRRRGEPPNPTRDIHLSFLAAYHEAMGEFERGHLDHISASTKWEAHLALLDAAYRRSGEHRIGRSRSCSAKLDRLLKQLEPRTAIPLAATGGEDGDDGTETGDAHE